MLAPRLLEETSSPTCRTKDLEEEIYSDITDGPETYKLVQFDPKIGETKIYKGSESTIGEFLGKPFAFPNGQTPSTKLLSFHVQHCYLNALDKGWISRDEKKPRKSLERH